MLFNTLEFFVFLPVILVTYHLLQTNVARLKCLFIGSIFFYANWNPPFVVLLFTSIFVDYFASHAMEKYRDKRKLLLLLSVCTNLGILAAFKYRGFILSNVAELFQFLDISDWEAPSSGFLLPVGISFYTFQTMSYTIDVYRGKVKPFKSLLEFSVYVSFFPQLVAGPIVRAMDFQPQLSSLRTINIGDIYRGVSLIVLGLVKKVVLADWLAALFVEPIYREPHAFDGFSNLAAVYAYSFQIFLDFSGYVDIAIGCALLLGYRLPENFKTPYLASNITEFWHRWHMTLSSWLRDYLYISLGGNRKGKFKTYRNLMITMLLGGLWHGASWNFIIWGGIHGLYLILHRFWVCLGFTKAFESKWTRFISTFFCFNLVTLTWIFFRAHDVDQAATIFKQVASIFTSSDPILILTAILLSPSILILYYCGALLTHKYINWLPTKLVAVILHGIILGACILSLAMLPAPGIEFIYFQF